jgi:hypothetical protein
MRNHLRVVDVPISLSGPDEIVGPIVAAYRRFVVSESEAAGAHPIEYAPDAFEGIRDGDDQVPMIAGIHPSIQIYDRFLNAIFDRARHHAVLHAAAVARDASGCSLIAGPTGHGKTSMTLELVDRGFRFLSDDYAPMDLESGHVSAYPRTVGIVVEGNAPVPTRFREAAAAPEIPRLLGKSLVDVGDVLGDGVLLQESVPVRHVFVLDAGVSRQPVEVSKIEFGVWPEAVEEVEQRLSSIDGVSVVARSDRDDITVWRVEVRHGELSAPDLSALLDEKYVAFSYGRTEPRPDFDAEPRLDPLTRRETATFLCREMQNRRGRGELMRRFGGDTTALFLGVAGALVGARCWKLTVGRLEPTVDLIQQAVG